jgi:hypothetical protein
MSRILPKLQAQTTFDLNKGKLAFGRGGNSGMITLRGRLTVGLDGADLALPQPVTLALSDADGVFYAASIPAGALRPVAGGFLFSDPAGSIANGLTRLKLKARGGLSYTVGIDGRHVDLAGADHDEITVTLEIGGDVASTTVGFERRPRILVYP